MALFYGLFVFTFVYQVDAFPEGAPVSTCFTQYPKHDGVGTQTTPSPYLITTSPSKYRPGDLVTIEVTDTTGHDFQGIQMAGMRASGNQNEIVGRFEQFPTDKLKAFNCYGGHMNMLSHLNNQEVSRLVFKWRAPNKNVGDVVFRSTILRSFKVFWYDVLKELPVDSTASVVPPTIQEIPVVQQTTWIDFDSCGDTKGCFYYPFHCSGSDCIAAATYEYRPTSRDYLFELHTNSDSDYVSLGFSDDVWMGEDFTLSCTGRNGEMSVQEGLNPEMYNERHFGIFSSEHEVKYEDGIVQCRFIMPQTFDMYQVSQDGEPNKTAIPWYLQDEMYLFLAWGETMPESDVIAHHHDLPAISKSKVNIANKKITYSSAYHVMVRAHGSLMIVAWIFLTGIVTVVSRHYRDWLSNKKLWGTKVWFQVHRELAVLVAMMTAIGFIVIFAHYGTGIRHYADPHAYVGIVVMALVGCQVIAGMARPGLDHKLRPIFNWGHRFLGHATHILAAATMFLAYEIPYTTPDMKKFGFIVLSVWVGVQVVWHVVFEIFSWRQKSAKTDNYVIEGKDVTPVTDMTKGQNSTSLTILFSVYLICLAALCVAALLSFLFY